MLCTIMLCLTLSSPPLPVRDCDTDGDCEEAIAEMGCREFRSIRRPNVQFVCDRAEYTLAMEGYRQEQSAPLPRR